MKNTLIAMLIIFVMSSCLTDKKEAIRILEAEGYTQIRITGYNCFACSEDDVYATGFIAKTITGKEVKGTVCGGWFKGHTIRID